MNKRVTVIDPDYPLSRQEIAEGGYLTSLFTCTKMVKDGFCRHQLLYRTFEQDGTQVLTSWCPNERNHNPRARTLADEIEEKVDRMFLFGESA